MLTRHLLTTVAVACTMAGTIGVPAASANERVFFNKDVSLSKFEVSGTPRNSLYAGGGEISNTTGSFEFCVASEENNTGAIEHIQCGTGTGFIETFGGFIPARVLLRVTHKSGGAKYHLVGEEFWE